MSCSIKKNRADSVGNKRFLTFIVSCALALGSAQLPSVAHAKKQRSPAPAESAPAKADPEALLIGVYKELGAGRLRQAQAKADALVEAYPNFRLGQLIRGDLLMMHSRPVRTFGAAPVAPDDKLQQLREEAVARLKWLRERPSPDLMPRVLLQLREDQKHALVVDAKRSRLYVYENLGDRLRLVTDYYISQGKYGVNKLKEGDQKTPIGVYYITSHLRGARLPDFYGTGALPINYPNEWDKMHGRSGSGIWLHGTPSDSYSRPPLSSDGCVVLTNPDLNQLTASVEVGKTPVLIAEQVEFVSRTKWMNDRNLAARLLEEWRRDAESLSSSRLMTNYSRKFKTEKGEDLATWFPKQHQFMRGIKKLSLTVKDVTTFFYPGREDLIVTTFTQYAQIGKSRSTTRKRQYWEKEGGQWKIVYELNL